MDLIELKISDFLELLASDAPAPGGGAASALAGAIGVSLVEMVVSLTKGREKYREFETLMNETGERAKELRQSLCNAANADAEAFSHVSRAYKMSVNTPEEKAEKEKALQSALIKATEAPLALMELTLEASKLCEGAIGRSNPNAAGDLSVAAALLRAAAQGAKINIDANLPIIKDEGLSEAYRQKCARLFSEINGIADGANCFAKIK